jgi:hypothetical protein
VAAVELHAIDYFEFELDALGLFDGDDALRLAMRTVSVRGK